MTHAHQSQKIENEDALEINCVLHSSKEAELKGSSLFVAPGDRVQSLFVLVPEGPLDGPMASEVQTAHRCLQEDRNCCKDSVAGSDGALHSKVPVDCRAVSPTHATCMPSVAPRGLRTAALLPLEAFDASEVAAVETRSELALDDRRLRTNADAPAVLAAKGLQKALGVEDSCATAAPLPPSMTSSRVVARRSTAWDALDICSGCAEVGGAWKREEEANCLQGELSRRPLGNEEQQVDMSRSRPEMIERDPTARLSMAKRTAGLSEEVMHLRKRLQMLQAEVSGWRQEKQSLVEESARRGAELRCAKARISHLEDKQRRLEFFLREARAETNAQAEDNITLQAQLAHKVRLLHEAELQSKRAWQTTNTSIHRAEMAINSAQAATKEVKVLRNEVDRRIFLAPSSKGEQAETKPATRTVWTTHNRQREFAENSTSCETRGREKDRSNGHEAGRSAQITRTASSDSGVVCGSVRDSRSQSENSTGGKRSPTCSSSGSLILGKVCNEESGTMMRHKNNLEIKRKSEVAARRQSAFAWLEEDTKTARVRGRELCEWQRHDSGGVKGALMAASLAWAEPSSYIAKKKTCVDDDRLPGASPLSDGRPVLVADVLGADEGACVGESRSDVYDKGCSWQYSQDVHGRRKDLEDTESALAICASPGQPVHAAGHARGRDAMAPRRSSLRGSGIGVLSELESNHDKVKLVGDHQRSGVGTAEGSSRISPANAVVDGDVLHRHPSWGPAIARWADGLKPGRRKTIGCGSLKANEAVTSCVESVSVAPGIVGQGSGGRDPRGRTARIMSAPFATDAVEDELRPVREMEQRLMLLQIEMNQLDAKQSKLVPKARTTRRAREEITDIQNRLAYLGKEASGLRRILREKPWRM